MASAHFETIPSALRRGPEYLFAALLLAFGLVFVFVLPPCQTPDELAHFLRAYQVSEGRFVPMVVRHRGGGEVPVGLLQVLEPFRELPLHPDRQTSLDQFTPLWSVPLHPHQRREVPFANSTYYSFVPYVPQAVGIAQARMMGAGPLLLFYAGRISNLAFGVVLLFFAIRLTPVLKLVFGLIALVPMTVQQFASQSPDVSTIGVAFLTTALFLRLAVLPRSESGRGSLFALIGLVVWLTLCKFPYAAFLLLYLALPVDRIGGRRRYAQIGLGLLVAVLGLAAAQMQLKKFAPDGVSIVPGASTNIEGQLAFITHHPLDFARVLAGSCTVLGKAWLDQLGVLGWLDTPLNPLAMHLFFVFMVVVALGDRSEWQPALGLRLTALATAGLCTLIMLTSLYVGGNPVGHKVVAGVQGRYFLPLLPLLLLALPNRLFEVRVAPELLRTWTAAAGAAIFVIALAGVIRRYYLPPDAQLWLSPVALAAAFLLIAGVTWWASRGFALSFRAIARETINQEGAAKGASACRSAVTLG